MISAPSTPPFTAWGRTLSHVSSGTMTLGWSENCRLSLMPATRSV